MKNRIKELREAAKLSQPALADLVGCGKSQIVKLERGERRLTVDWMERISKALDVSPAELIAKKGQAPQPSAVQSQDLPDETTSTDGLATVDELDVRAGAADGCRVPTELRREKSGDIVEHIPVRQQWVLPTDIASRVTRTRSDGLKILTVQGTSMVPDFFPGDRIMVDTADTTPSPPGNFIVWDGLNLVVKFVQHLAHSDPPTVRLTSRHPDVTPYERTIDEAYIQGRVIGKWQWT